MSRLAVLVLLLAGPAFGGEGLIDDPQRAVETWIRLKGDMAGGLTYEWVRGTAYGIPDGQPSVPLFDIESVTLRQVLEVGDGRYVEQSYACRLYRDAGTGAYIDRFINPINNESTALTAACGPGPSLSLSAAGMSLMSDMQFESTGLDRPMRLDLIETPDRVVVRREASSTFVSPSSGERRRELSIDTFKLSRADFESDATMLAPAYSWVSVTQWMTALGMGDLPGRMLWTVNGRNYADSNRLPAEFRKALADRFPDALAHRFDWSAYAQEEAN